MLNDGVKKQAHHLEHISKTMIHIFKTGFIYASFGGTKLQILKYVTHVELSKRKMAHQILRYMVVF